MSKTESNNEFFSYNGTISRKNYVINLLILIGVLVGLNLIRFENFAPYIQIKFLYSAMIFMASFLEFVMLMSLLSVVYRRIADFSTSKSIKFQENMKKVFAIFFVFPAIYLYCIRYFIDFIPTIRSFLDIFTTFCLIPVGFIASIVFCFIKRGE